MDRAWYYGPWRGAGDVRRVVTNANFATIFRQDEVTSVMQSSMRGNWGKHGIPEEGGIVQDMERLSWLAFLSHLRRTNNPLDRSLKIVDPHYLHSTQWGALCPVESPDGANVGLTNNLALLCEVTASRDPAPAVLAAEARGARPLSAGGGDGDEATVYVNGVPMFSHPDPVTLCRGLREDRRGGKLHHPLRRIGADVAAPDGSDDWDALVASGAVEYVDVDEAEDALIAWDADSASKKDRHTHAELHVTAGLSVFEVTMPLMQHNPSPRNVLAAGQGKQGAGLYTSAFRSRIDTMGMVLNYPQLPLVTTMYEKINAQASHPGGVNTIVAFMTCTGFNMEDGVIINRSAVDRGLFSMTYFKNHLEEEDVSVDGAAVRFGNPTSAGSLDANGMPRENEAVVPGQLMIGKMRSSGAGGFVPVDGVGVRADEKWEGYVTDKVFVFEQQQRDGRSTAQRQQLKAAKVRYRKLRKPKPGDKLAARHAQKGVIGAMVPEHMMPYTADGVVPDIIVNPHAIPSRMTIGQFMECLGAKAAAAGMSRRVDGTPFEPVDVAALEAALLGAGFHGSCNEVMYSFDGRQLDADVFIGPTYYQRLKQMVEDKINYRGRTGARDNVTNQPVKGRARGGGLRMGEMENSCVLAHGLMGMAAESTTERSDGRAYSWQDGEGTPAVFNESQDFFRPGAAHDEDKRFRRRAIPRAFVALEHELAAMGVGVKLLDEAREAPMSDFVPPSCGRPDPFVK